MDHSVTDLSKFEFKNETLLYPKGNFYKNFIYFDANEFHLKTKKELNILKKLDSLKKILYIYIYILHTH